MDYRIQTLKLSVFAVKSPFIFTEQLCNARIDAIKIYDQAQKKFIV